jgi:hypothetical protein
VARLSEGLVTPYHGFAILVGSAFAAAVLWPESAPPTFGPLVRGPFLHQAMAFLIGILGLQIGEAERGFGPHRPLGRACRLAALVGFGLVLVSPFLLIHRVETALAWPRFAALVGFQFAFGLSWSLAGYALATVVHSDGLRFIVKYGCLLALVVLPALAGLPVSPIPVVGVLWAGEAAGLWGLAAYGGLSVGALGAWIWMSRRSSTA